MQAIRLIVGLGNPGQQYEFTRHNVGFWLLDQITRQLNTTLVEQKKFFGHTGLVTIDAKQIHLLRPNTFMNLSGQSVQSLCQFYKIQIHEMLVVHDELDLPCGAVRFKTGGGHGGHNGLRDIMSRLGNQRDFHRLRIGINHPGHASKVHGHVLSKPSAADQLAIQQAIHAALEHLPALCKGEMQAVMRQLHQKSTS